MSEYIVNVPNEEAECFIARFGFENVTLFGYRLIGEIVRCRDCELEMNGYCSRPDEWNDDLWFPVESNGYCAWGQRKAVEQ